MDRTLEQITHLTFDVATAFDWHRGIASALGRPLDASGFASDYHDEFFCGLGEVRSGGARAMTADELHRQALDRLLPGYAPLQPDAAGRERVDRICHRRPAWPDIGDVLARLRRRYTVSIFTGLSLSATTCLTTGRGLNLNASMALILRSDG